MLRQLNFAMTNGLNVLLQGAHGIGKTTVPLALFKQHNINHAYFNCPVLDIHEDLKGIPVNNKGKLEYILPSHRKWNEVEFIMLDEPNRAHIKVVNTLYELIQFRAINGISLPKLRGVWAAINPDNGDYTVESIDQSFYDRFHIHINVLPELNEEFFCNLGIDNEQFVKLTHWWKAVPEDQRNKYASPRRVEYAVRVFKLGGEIADVLPASIMPDKLQALLNGEENVMDGIDANKTFLDNYKQYLKEGKYEEFVKIFDKVPIDAIAAAFPYRDETKEKDTAKVIKFITDVAEIAPTEQVLTDIVRICGPVSRMMVTICYHYKDKYPTVVQDAASKVRQYAPALAAKALINY